MISTSKTKLAIFGILIFGLVLPCVASATFYSLMETGDVEEVNGGLFFQIDEMPAGTGYIDPFVRIQDATRDGGFVDGVNTSDRPFQHEEKNPLNYTHDLLLSDVSVVDYGGTLYRDFYLDFNEATGSGLEYQVTLDRIKIFNTVDTDTRYDPFLGAGLSGWDDYGPFNGADLVYDLDNDVNGGGGVEDNAIMLNFLLDNGSGEANMRMLIPDEYFNGKEFVYLYSAFGETGGDWANSDGFEEWYTAEGTPPVPEPATFLLLGSGLAALAAFRRRQNRK